MKLKDRVVIISEKNMDRMNALGKCTTEELERIVNNMIENAIYRDKLRIRV